MATWTLALFLPVLFYGCGSGSDEITITCTNSGSGQIVCGAAGGSTIDQPQSTRTPGR